MTPQRRDRRSSGTVDYGRASSNGNRSAMPLQSIPDDSLLIGARPRPFSSTQAPQSNQDPDYGSTANTGDYTNETLANPGDPPYDDTLNGANEEANGVEASVSVNQEVDLEDTTIEASAISRRFEPNGGGAWEKLDSRYQLQKDPDFFCFGRVLMVLFSDSYGNKYNLHEDDQGSLDGTEITVQTFKNWSGNFHVGVRRMIVVHARTGPGRGRGRGHSLCVPISTYSQRGTLKTGLEPKDHAIIYIKNPTLLKGERLQKSAIQLVPTYSKEYLHPASRIDFGRVHTVNHNTLVRDLGMVHENHLLRLKNYFKSSIFSDNNRSQSQVPGSAYPPSTSVHQRPSSQRQLANQLTAVDELSVTRPLDQSLQTPSYSSTQLGTAGSEYSKGNARQHGQSYSAPNASYGDTRVGFEPNEIPLSPYSPSALQQQFWNTQPGVDPRGGYAGYEQIQQPQQQASNYQSSSGSAVPHGYSQWSPSQSTTYGANNYQGGVDPSATYSSQGIPRTNLQQGLVDWEQGTPFPTAGGNNPSRRRRQSNSYGGQ
ncbi:MAG: hypothetical protein M1814_005609 [Vezdaea aestivalis]|nr:MAG: hypothetical protein M1814_005609 [Vezdaea aestivalis]